MNGMVDNNFGKQNKFWETKQIHATNMASTSQNGTCIPSIKIMISFVGSTDFMIPWYFRSMFTTEYSIQSFSCNSQISKISAGLLCTINFAFFGSLHISSLCFLFFEFLCPRFEFSFSFQPPHTKHTITKFFAKYRKCKKRKDISPVHTLCIVFFAKKFLKLSLKVSQKTLKTQKQSITNKHKHTVTKN